MKLFVAIRNPRRPTSYLTPRGFTSNEAEAHVFESIPESIDHAARFQPFLHLEDEPTPQFVDVTPPRPEAASPVVEVRPEIQQSEPTRRITLAKFAEPMYWWEGLYVDGKLVLNSDAVTVEEFVPWARHPFTFESGYVANLDDIPDDEIPVDLSDLVLTPERPGA